MSKKCKVCWQPRDHDNPLVSRCKKCQYEHSNNNKKQTRINLVSKTNKNTPARFSKEVKAQILMKWNWIIQRNMERKKKNMWGMLKDFKRT